ncbi:uncharacterized protein SAPINGB_P004184 [Magnusiomyces paraingens]|uniref:Major facilitator superfamily (MFS) profile domain-containing protein n=1 Tax=Magnusiomyces paraingens TaxID=2606893 RepID=A0A5E8BVB0_9ASCO|nr:uncharacterized protein SAPINGB_P004184 [Saprochaete ingens]VVT54654.1 unnamed protein product [Saprochaete ingens]
MTGSASIKSIYSSDDDIEPQNTHYYSANSSSSSLASSTNNNSNDNDNINNPSKDDVENDDEEVPGTLYYIAETECTTLPDGSDMALKRRGDVVLSPQPSDSPNDPLNWSFARKAWHLAIIMMFTGFTAAISNITAGAQELMNAEIGEYMGDIMTYANGILFVGIGLMTYLLSPSAFLYGRRMAYLICITLGIAGSVLFGKLSGSVDAFWSQLLVGAAMGAAEAQVQLSVTDIFFLHQQGLAVSLYVLTTALGTYLGPLIAGFIVDGSDAEQERLGKSPIALRRYVSGWRWIGWWAMAVALALFLLMTLCLEETYFDRKKYYNRAAKLFPSEGNSDVTLVEDKTNTKCTTKSVRNSLEDSDLMPAVLEEGSNIPRSNTSDSIVSQTPVVRTGLMGADEPPNKYFTRIAPITPASNLLGFGFQQYIRRLFLTLRVLLFPPVIYAGIQWGAQNSWLSFYLNTMADVWSQPPYNYSSGQIGLMNLPCIIGALLGCSYGGILSDKFVNYVRRKNIAKIEKMERRIQEMGGLHQDRTGSSGSILSAALDRFRNKRVQRFMENRRRRVILEPETRLWMLVPTAIISPLGMFLFGIGTVRHWPWTVSYMGLLFIGFGWGCAGDLSMSYLMDAYPQMVLEGMVGVSLVNNGIAAIFTFFCQKWVDNEGNYKTYLALGSLNLFFFLLTFPMIIKGKWCRKMTSKMYKDFIKIRDGQN